MILLRHGPERRDRPFLRAIKLNGWLDQLRLSLVRAAASTSQEMTS